MEGHDIRRDMGAVYGLMGVCPQHDLLWEQLTAREHMLFYGRLKNLEVCAGHKVRSPLEPGGVCGAQGRVVSRTWRCVRGARSGACARQMCKRATRVVTAAGRLFGKP